ncbi:MAG TPA: methyltransferase domain-containing protein [Solirubrobacteraceae bacterium]|nr:methyltransferase domain-containing protein [Solirubrobacteraceae bacterium]
MTRHAPTAGVSLSSYSGPPPANYQRYFVPAIGLPLAVELVEAAALRAGERILDVACGTGVVARLAAEQVGAGGAVTGVDVNAGMLSVARSVPADGAPIDWHEAEAATTGLPDAAYDAVLCQLGLQFFPDRAAAAREMRRVLAPGGRILVNVPCPTPLFEIFEQALAEHVARDAAGFVATVFSLSDASALEDLFAGAGCEDVAVASGTRRLRLAPPEEFLWQYISSTPLAPQLAAVDEHTRTALARDLAERWEPFAGDDGTMVMEFDVLTARAR